MTPQYIIVILYIISFLYIYRMFQMSGALYDKLPDRIPIHFNIRGAADGWARKNRLSVNLLPLLGIIISIAFFIVFWFLPRQDETVTDEFLALSALGTFFIVYMLYRLHSAMLKYALGEKVNVTLAALPGFAGMLACWAVFLLLPLAPSNSAVKHITLCENVRDGRPINEKDVFTTDDDYAVVFLTLGNVRGRHEVIMRWIDPDRRLYYENRQSSRLGDWKKSKNFWSWIYLKKKRKHIKHGVWAVEIFLDGRLRRTVPFKIQ
ncbi:MAG: DUF1648 domain-containing protein [bacterium]